MNDEDDEFVDLFEGDICYIAGGNQSGFYLVEEPGNFQKMTLFLVFNFISCETFFPLFHHVFENLKFSKRGFTVLRRLRHREFILSQ